PTFLRTKVRAPTAVPGGTVNTYKTHDLTDLSRACPQNGRPRKLCREPRRKLCRNAVENARCRQSSSTKFPTKEGQRAPQNVQTLKLGCAERDTTSLKAGIRA